MVRVLGLLALVLLGACATTPQRLEPAPVIEEVRDPFEPVNRQVFKFNRVVDDLFIAPVAWAYVTVFPKPVRRSASNFTDNLIEPSRAINEVLQADMPDAGNTSARFLINTTLGVAGLFDPATGMGFERRPEDFGQTLGNWGVPQGPYLQIPLLGPSTGRDGLGAAGGLVLSPAVIIGYPAETQGIFSTQRLINTRAESSESLMRIYGSPDAYTVLRSLYVQQRAAELHEDADPYENLPDF